MYYSSLDHFSKMYDKLHRQFPAKLSSAEDFLKWQDEARAKLKKILFVGELGGSDLNPVIEEEIVLPGDIVRQKVVIDIFEDEKMPMYVLIPKNYRKDRTFIAISGHAGGGMAAVVGDRSDELVSGAIDKFNYDYGLELAKRGYVTICPETRGFGMRREEAARGDDQILKCSCYNMARVATGLGYNLFAFQVYDLMRAIDYIYENGEWNTDKLTVLGFSGGGYQGLYLSAVDERVKELIISGYMYGYKESLFYRNGNCSCNYVPDLWKEFDMGDIGALIAPRTFVIQSGDKDHLNGESGLLNVYSQVDVVKGAYSLTGGRVMHDVCDGPHKWYKDRLDNYLEFLDD